VGTKFLLSPKIDAQLSQRTEGKIRDKSSKDTPKSDTRVTRSQKKDVVDSTETLPKAPKPKEPRADEELEDDDEIATVPVPDKDLNPKKTQRLTATVNQSQPKEEPMYKNRAPVEIGLDIEKLVDSVLEMEVTIPLKSLAGVSGAIQKEIRKQVTKTRAQVDEQSQKKEASTSANKVYIQDLPFESTIVRESTRTELPVGSIVGGDPVLQYVMQNENADFSHLTVGKMTEPLRSIYTKINGIGQEECLLDGGSMIVSISKKVAVQLGLVWDPAIRIDMESASNHVDRTLGVARNVPFEVGGLKLFLQVHVLEDPPYRVLLGKPFETLGSTVLQTFEDGTAEIVIKDPNTKRVAVVPTYRRGETPEGLQQQKYQNF
jgi:hypothetical protein